MSLSKSNIEAAPTPGLATEVGRAAWTALLILACVDAINYTDRLSLAILVEPIKHDLHFSDFQVGTFTGLAFSLFYAILGIPIARYADRTNRAWLIAAALLIWSAMTALVGRAQSFWQLFGARVGVGAGEAGCIPAAHSLISDLFPPERRALALSIFNTGGLVGATLGLGVAGWLAQNYGWRSTLWVLAAPGLAVGIILLFILHEPVRGGFDGGSSTVPLALRDALRKLFSRRSYIYLVLASAAAGFASMGIAQWTPAFMMRAHGMNLAEAGAGYALANGAASIVGMLLGGWLSDRLRRHDVRWILWVGSIALFLSWPITAASFLVRDTRLMLALFASTAVIGNIPSGAMVSFVQSVTHPRARALAVAIAAFTVSLIAFGAGPMTIGAISDLLSHHLRAVDALRDALVTVSITYVVAAWLLVRAAKRLRDDLSAVARGQ